MPRRARLAACLALGATCLFLLPVPGLGRQAGTGAPAVRRVNVPNLTGEAFFAPAIFWFGKVGSTSNYADVRVWHYQTTLRLAVHITDRFLRHASSPTAAQLTAWDAVSVFVNVGGTVGQAPGAASYWFVKQLGNDGVGASAASYTGTGSGWVSGPVTFTATTSWRGNGPNDTLDDWGWLAEFKIPFSALGLSGPPPAGTVWRLGIAVHDRDDAAGTAIADRVWPEGLQRLRPDTWGQLAFGRPVNAQPAATVGGVTTIRQGLNGAVVPDAAVGGHTLCGGSACDTPPCTNSLNAWTEWADTNYSVYSRYLTLNDTWKTQFNIQNQWDISDFMCFSKYYVTFPLDAVPAGKAIVSARVSLSLFGNAGYVAGDAEPSAINVLSVADAWAEDTITWNNAPYAAENLSVTQVFPVDAAHPAGPYTWDVSDAAAAARRNGTPLRLAFYSTDGEQHSGKYFWTSNVGDWGASLRPTLEVRWSSALPPSVPTGLRIVK